VNILKHLLNGERSIGGDQRLPSRCTEEEALTHLAGEQAAEREKQLAQERESMRETLARHYAFRLVALCTISCVVIFYFAVAHSEQGVDLWRAGQDNFWAAFRLLFGVGILIAICCGGVAALFEEKWPVALRSNYLSSPTFVLCAMVPMGIGAIVVDLLLPPVFEDSYSFWLGAANNLFSYMAFTVLAYVVGALLYFGLTAIIVFLLLSPKCGAGAVVVAVILIGAITAAPAQLGEWLGTVPTLALGLSGWLLFAIALVRWVVLSTNGFKIFLFIAVVLVLVKFVAPPSRDLIRGEYGYKKGQSFREALLQVVDRQHGQTPDIIIVAAAGGGIRASYWTAKILTHIVDKVPKARDKLFLASGVSGGSVGLALFRALLATPGASCGPDEQLGALESCTIKFHEQDFLAGILGASVTRNVFNSLVPIFPARSVALEKTLEARWHTLSSYFEPGPNLFSGSFRSLSATGDSGFALVLNTTSVSRGDRIPISNLNTEDWLFPLFPCKVNIAEQVDLPLSAAANTSARFPFLEDWGWFPTANGGQKDSGCESEEAVADGGFYDNFGAVTALNAYNKAKSLLEANNKRNARIMVIQITSDPECETAGFLDERDDRVTECNKIKADSQAANTPIKQIPLKGRHPSTLSRQELAILEPEAWEIYIHNERISKWKKLSHDLGFDFDHDPKNPSPLAVLMQVRSITGLVGARQLKNRVEKARDNYYHFSLAGALDAPLGWVLSRDSREQIDGRLNPGTLNQKEMDRLITDLSR
jgi:hypothetical protein